MGRSHKHNLSERSPNENNIHFVLCPYILKTGQVNSWRWKLEQWLFRQGGEQCSTSKYGCGHIGVSLVNSSIDIHLL